MTMDAKQIADRLEALREAQASDMENLERLQRNIAVRTGRIAELERLTMHAEPRES